MKHHLFFKTALSLLLAACILATGLMMIGAAEEEDKTIDPASLTPDVSDMMEDPQEGGQTELPAVGDGTTPTAQTQLEGEFGGYSFVSEEDGKSVVTVYSEEQIADFNARREAGEWFSLNAEQISYLVINTRELFETYDIIRVYSLDGTLNTYRGSSFYTSEEYYDLFGPVTEETDATCNLSEDMHFAIVNRLSVLVSAVAQPDECNSTKCTVVFTDVEAYPDAYELIEGQDEMDCLGRLVDQYWFWQHSCLYYDYAWYDAQPLQAYEGGAFIFVTKENSLGHERAYFISDISALDLNDYTCLYDSAASDCGGKYEYAYDGKSVIAEVWDESEQKLVARMRLDDTDNAAEVAKIEQLWDGVVSYLHSDAYQEVPTDEYFKAAGYTVTLYLNNIDFLPEPGLGDSTVIHYRADETGEYWSFGEYSRQPVFQLHGTQELAAYVNSLLEQYLTAE